MNNKAQFVGRYAVQVGIDPFYGWPIYEYHGFVATPAAEKRSHEFVAKAGGEDRSEALKSFRHERHDFIH